MFKTLKTFYKFAAENRWLFAGFIFVVVVSAILANLTPYFFKLFVDLIPSQNFNKLFSVLIIYIGVRYANLASFIFSNYLGDLNLIPASIKARSTIFKKVQDLDFVFHTSKSTGSLISAFKRGDSAFFNFFDTINHKILEIFISLIVMLYFFSKIDIRITFSAIISVILTLVATRFLIKNNLKQRIKFNTEEDNISAVITDNLINFETVKLFAKESWEQTRLKEEFKNWSDALWAFANSFRLVDITIGTTINLGVFGILAFLLLNATSQKINIGDFVLVAAFINNFVPRLWDLTWSFKDIAKHYADIEKYFGLLDERIEVLDPVNPVKLVKVNGIVNFNNVNFVYKGRAKNAIRDFNLEIKKGESIALVGRSGSGKTTLAKLLMRFYDINSGEITIDGININKFNKSTLRSFVGVVPQEPILFNNTIEYNIGYGYKGSSLTYSAIRQAAKIANIDKFILSLKDKYKTEVGERGVKLSGGQKQRLAIARMILSDPDIVVFDEATSHLDSESEKLIQDAFWKARAGKTTIIIAHRLSTIMRADKIVVMEHGQIKEIGTHETLLKDENSLYKHFWDLQIKLD